MAASSVQSSFRADVLAFANQQGVAGFLLPVLELTQHVFPDARRIDATLDDDPELTGDRHIVFEVTISGLPVSRSVDRHWEWSRELFQICPPKYTCLFGLHVTLVEA